MIYRVKDLGSTPARVNRNTGDIYLNCKIWNKIDPKEQNFILQHEKGHFVLNTRDETKADNYAFDHYAGTEPFSLKGILHAIGDRLDIKNNPAHQKRYKNIVKKLLQFDAANYGNKYAKQILDEMNTQEKINIFPAKNYKILMSMLVDFLKNKGINNIKEVPKKIRAELLEEFLQTKEVIYLLAKTNESIESFGSKNGDKGGWFGHVISGAAAAVGTAFGIPPAITAGASELIQGGIRKIGTKLKDRLSGKVIAGTKQPDIETLDWNAAQQEGQISSFKTYLSKYPTGKYVSQAQAQIKAIDDKAFQNAQTGNSIDSYSQYLAAYPDGLHISEANTKISELKKKKTTMFAGIAAAIVIIVVLVIVLKR